MNKASVKTVGPKHSRNRHILERISELISDSLEECDEMILPDGGVHPLVAVLDILEIAENGELFADVIYSVRGFKIVKKVVTNNTVILTKQHAEYL